MARPTKNNADYFPHDAGMRNHKKVKALRSKFGINGYAIWSMMLEHLTGSDGNVFPYTDLEFELMSGDFGVSATEIRSVVDYCIMLELLFNTYGFIKSESLDERLAPVYEKRNKSKELSKQQQRASGKFVINNADDTAVSVTEMPQSKVKYSKVKEISIYKPQIKSFDSNEFFKNSESAFEELKNDEMFLEPIIMAAKGRGFRACDMVDILGCIKDFILTQAPSGEIFNKPKKDVKQHFSNWLRGKKPEEISKIGMEFKKQLAA